MNFPDGVQNEKYMYNYCAFLFSLHGRLRACSRWREISLKDYGQSFYRSSGPTFSKTAHCCE